MLSLLILLFTIPAFAQVVIIDDFATPKSHGYQVQKVLKADYPGEIITLPVATYHQSLKKVIKLKPQVLNLSFGTQEYDHQEIELLKEISSQGTFIVVAAGNSNQKVNQQNPIYPCFYPIENLICVGAAQDSQKAPLSNYGPKIKVYTSGQYQGDNVTSFAAPRISAFVAQALSCSQQPLDLIHYQSMNIQEKEVSLVTNKAQDFCYRPLGNQPF